MSWRDGNMEIGRAEPLVGASGTVMKQDMQGYIMHKLIGMEELNANLQHVTDLLEAILAELRDNRKH